MPLVRAQVRNEYGMGSAELYREACRHEDPKALLDGVAVSGLIGLLRQLGDLAEFAADVFHELQEQVAATSSRSQKMVVRVQNIEASLAPLEKAVFSLKSHIHFAYVAGCDWHPRIRKQQKILVTNDLPKFIMDSYDECRDPPRLHMLDKFDNGGPGSCLKRYSDPSFYRRVSNSMNETEADRLLKDRKSRKAKKKRSFHRNRDFGSSSSSHLTGRIQCASPCSNERSFPYMSPKHDVCDQSNDEKDSTYCQIPAQLDIDDTFHELVPADTKKEDESRNEPQIFVSDGVPDAIQGNSGLSDRINAESIRSEKDVVAIDSEVEDYVDARNTIDTESDSENVHAKQNSEQFLEDQVAALDICDSGDQSIEEQIQLHPEIGESTNQGSVNSSECLVAASDVSGMEFDFPASHTVTKSPSEPSSADNLEVRDSTVVEEPQVKFPSDAPASNCEEDMDDKISNSQDSAVATIAIWTNGGLLGLQPSKPPVFGIPNRSNADGDSKRGEAEASYEFPASRVTDQGAVMRRSNSFRNSLRCIDEHNGLRRESETLEDRTTHDDAPASSNEDKPSRILGLFANGLRRTLSHGCETKNEFGKSKLHNQERKLNFVLDSPSSPPLERMKISLQPSSGLAMSALKLKLPDGKNGDRMNGDMFPSFQLVPEGISPQFGASDSDDDFFCGSPFYSSDDQGSNHSDMESELWAEEQETKSTKRDNEDDCMSASLSPNPLDIPCFEDGLPESPSDSRRKDSKHRKDESDLQHEAMYERRNRTAEPRVLEKSRSCSYTQETSSPTEREDAEEPYDFLNQIRAKSFTLRRTASREYDTASAPNDKVAAILKKADAIRKAVEISDEEDDGSTWSDS